MHLLQHTPQFSTEQALQLAREHYDESLSLLSALPSERDQNFLLQNSAEERFVLKIANALEDPAFLDAQHQVLTRLAENLDYCPRVVPTRAGAPLFSVESPTGARHLARLVTYLPGVPLGQVRHHAPELLRDLGRRLGVMDRALSDFDHPACHRDFHWDLIHGVRIVGAHLDKIADVEVRAVVRRLTDACAPLLPTLRRNVIHGDANDFNVLVAERRRVVGVIDFGDMLHSVTVANLAVAIAYVVLDKADFLSAAAHVVAGYHTEFPLSEEEIGALFGLVGLRLCLSACHAADQQRQRPDDEYLAITQGPLRRTLPRLAAVPPRLAEAVFRQACGWTPCPHTDALVRFLRQSQPQPLFDLEPLKVLDLGVGSVLVAGDEHANSAAELGQRIDAALREAGAHVGIGRYNEARLLYSTPLFGAGDERRTIHLGLDFFVPAGTPVRVPLSGTVQAVANNAAPLDYGPVVVLAHTTDAGQRYFTLYGHLSLATLANFHVGQHLEAGAILGVVGTADINGGWVPHLHFQLIADLLDRGTDFPGVACPRQREVWLSLSPDPNLIARIPAEHFPPTPTKNATLSVRRQRLGRNLSIAYRDPLKIERGWMQYLFDDEGRRYLDAYNNVPHVGHCHPHVVRAARDQLGVLSTNTRYLHDLVNRFAVELCATLPEPLRVCYLLNSASEANELALRLARAHTRRRATIVLEAAYHGHTNSLIDISPYKHAGPGGSGPPDWVHTVPIPDGYRGRFKYDDPQAGTKYADLVRDVAAQHSPAAFIAETCPSVGGQIFLPTGYLAEVYRHVRAAGGVCIADEVQTGYGRIGSHFWAFEAQDVVPDIVVMGKPIGNGHPLAAVVTTPDIAASFDNGMEFFSTFGGNTVSCAVGLAVLEVMRRENLQDHAWRVGQRLLAGLKPFVDKHPIVGDVRGSGLFLGVELVRDRRTLTPAGEEASLVANRMREYGILLGTDGPFHNVVKIRPPMPFSAHDADFLVATLDRVLLEEFC